jgi:glycosyltransferase involved in cell wall biosynthesis
MNTMDLENKRLSISICIATHERDWLLKSTLAAIARQSRPPDEVVISDSSRTKATEQIVLSFQRENPDLSLRYLKTECKTLPWHRWNGFRHSQGEIVFFMDDDITLASNALGMLEKAYSNLFVQYGINAVAGIGFYTFLDDGSEKKRRPNSFEERWLGTASLPSATITAGGLGIFSKEMPRDSLVEVGRLTGGRMTFRREVLDYIGFLTQLVNLYERGLGRSEDTVVSYYASRVGKLFMITYPLATHLRDERAVKTAYATNGLHKGLAETWGRAHTMQWMSTNKALYRRQWKKVATLEILRSVWWGIIRKPWAMASWTRFGGAIYGFLLGLFLWKRIPPSARLDSNF